MLLSRDVLEALGFTANERETGTMSVTLEVVDGELRVRRDTGEVVTASVRDAGAVAANESLKEWQQRLLQAVRDHGPATTVEIAAAVGRTREQTSTNLNKLRREGLVEREVGAGALSSTRLRAVRSPVTLSVACAITEPPAFQSVTTSLLLAPLRLALSAVTVSGVAPTVNTHPK